MRIGIGHDTHRLAEGGPLRLGGVDIPHDHHLVGHSDADVLLHAVTDALLGAAALEDIGELDNTLIMIISDNGASPEGGLNGTLNENDFLNHPEITSAVTNEVDTITIDGSITDRELVRRAVEGVDFIFHLAALVSVPESMSILTRLRLFAFSSRNATIAFRTGSTSQSITDTAFGESKSSVFRPVNRSTTQKSPRSPATISLSAIGCACTPPG
mgnify:CR=1 FL=1